MFVYCLPSVLEYKSLGTGTSVCLLCIWKYWRLLTAHLHPLSAPFPSALYIKRLNNGKASMGTAHLRLQSAPRGALGDGWEGFDFTGPWQCPFGLSGLTTPSTCYPLHSLLISLTPCLYICKYSFYKSLLILLLKLPIFFMPESWLVMTTVLGLYKGFENIDRMFSNDLKPGGTNILVQ